MIYPEHGMTASSGTLRPGTDEPPAVMPRRDLLLARVRLGIVVLGQGLSVALALRSRVGGEQLEILARGWWLQRVGHWIPFGMPASSGGATPGSVTSFLVAVPLFIWEDYRAVALFIGLLHLAAYLMLDAILSRRLSHGGRVAFAILFWLNPTRLYLSAMIWNPGFLIIFAAIHAWSAFHLSRHRSFWLTLVHLLSVTLAMQVHPSGALLAGGSVVLLLTRRLRLAPMGVAVAMGCTVLSLLPWLAAVQQQPELFPVQSQFTRGGLPVIHPVARGLSYWLRSTSLYGSTKITRLVPATVTALRLSDATLLWLSRGVRALLIASVILPLMAHLWFLRRLRRVGWLHARSARSGGVDWALSYAFAVLLGAIPLFALSPTSVMWWQVFVLFPAALLPMAVWWSLVLRSRMRRLAVLVLAGHVIAGGCTAVAVFVGGQMFNCGWQMPIKRDNVILRSLGVSTSCGIRLGREDGWWNPILDDPPRVVQRVFVPDTSP